MIEILCINRLKNYNIIAIEYFPPAIVAGKTLLLYGKTDRIIEDYRFEEGRPCFTDKPGHFIVVNDTIDISDAIGLDFIDKHCLLDKETMFRESDGCQDSEIKWTISDI